MMNQDQIDEIVGGYVKAVSSDYVPASKLKLLVLEKVDDQRGLVSTNVRVQE
jgi:hypothetical protein